MSLLQSKPLAATGLAKPASSLSSSMLARKGDARPGQRYMPEPGLEIPERTRVISFGADMRSSLPQAPLPDFFEPFTDALDFPVAADTVPEPVRAIPVVQIAPPELEEAWLPPAPIVPVRARKSAFTLRLDADRHLRLRLLSAHQHRSAQQIIIEAVDRMLADAFDPLLASGRISVGTRPTV